MASLAIPAEAQSAWTPGEAATRGVGWLRAEHQAAGFGTVDETVAALHALGDAGIDPRAWTDGRGVSLLDALAPQAATFAYRDAASAGRLVAGLAAAGQNPRALGGLNPLALLQSHYDPGRGLYGGATATPTDQAWALLALVAAREEAPAAVVDRLLAWQREDGGWAGSSGASDVETTALIVSALIRAGVPRSRPALGWATGFLSRSQLGAGGFGRDPRCGCLPDARSTARAIQAVLLLDQDPLSGGWQRPAGSPADWLRLRQAADGGMALFGFGAPDATSTALSISAFLGRPPGAPAVAPAVRSGVLWLRSRQTPGGGYAPEGGVPDVEMTLETVYALAAAGALDPPPPTGHGSTLGYLAAHAPRATALDLGRLIVAVVALGGNPHQLDSDDLVARLESLYSPSDGAYGARASDQAWALLGLAAIHRPPPLAAVARLIELQAPDGGWRPAVMAASDSVTTALAIQALAAVGDNGDARARALSYLRARQQPDGGFAAAVGVKVSSTRATAAALQALRAASEIADGPAWTQHALPANASPLTANTPPRAILDWQGGDGGFPLQPDFVEADPLATAQAVAALGGRSQPIAFTLVRIFLPLVSH